jgi:hypothetical protein
MEFEASSHSATADEASDAVWVEQPAPGEQRDGTPADAADASVAADAGELTGAAAVAARLHDHLDAVGSLAGIELGEHVDFYQRVHGDLQGALKDIDDA